jgi:hypothetical protein
MVMPEVAVSVLVLVSVNTALAIAAIGLAASAACLLRDFAIEQLSLAQHCRL